MTSRNDASLLSMMIRSVPNFPEPGIDFKDITPILRDPASLRQAVDAMTDPFRELHVDLIVGLESRGFLFGMPIAYNLGVGFIPVRKAGKLPSETIGVNYNLEYGSNSLEIHRDAITSGQNVLLVDDLLATGGTMAASIGLVEQLGGHIVGASFLIELPILNGRHQLQPHTVHSVICD